MSFGNGLTTIGGSAFYGCSALTSIEIGDAVTSIGKKAFKNCRNVESVIIGNHVTSIGVSAFEACSSITIPNSVVTIDGSAFSSCSSLTSLSFGNGLTTIGGGAFFGCSALTSIEIPQSVTSIVVNPFASCRGLTTMTVDANNTVYDSRNNCNAIIEKSTKTLISGCKNTIIPNTVSAIGVNAFGKCTGLTSIDIPNSVTTIGTNAFSNCTGLTSIDIPNSVTTIGTNAFSNCTGLTSVSIGNGVTSLGSSAFLQCTSLANVTIGNRVTSIGGSAFSLCNSLNSMTIPASVTSIGDYAFQCENLTLLEVKNSVPIQITQYTFPYRTNTTLVVPDGSRDKYKSSIYWSDFKYIINKEDDMLNMLVMSDSLVEHGAWIDFPVSMNNQEQITAAEFDLQVPNGVKLLSCSMTERKNGHEINFVQNGNNYHVTIFSLTSSSIDGNEGELLSLKLLAGAEGGLNLTIKNIELSTKEGERRNPPDVSATVTINDIPLGDVNGDGEVTITDAVSIVNHRLDRTPVRFISAAADLNADNEITITDAVKIVNMILSTNSNAKLRIEPAISLPEPQ